MKMKQKFSDIWTLHFSSILKWRPPLSAALDLTMHFAYFALLCTLYYLRHGIEIFSDFSLWIGATVLFKNIDKIFYMYHLNDL